MMIVSMVMGTAKTRNFLNDMGYPAFSARPRVMTLADAPTGVPFPPRHAPRASDHHTGIRVEW